MIVCILCLCFVFCVLCSVFCVLCSVFCVLCFVFRAQCSVLCLLTLVCLIAADAGAGKFISHSLWPTGGWANKPFRKQLTNLKTSVFGKTIQLSQMFSLDIV